MGVAAAIAVAAARNSNGRQKTDAPRDRFEWAIAPTAIIKPAENATAPTADQAVEQSP
jgi:hypothetical protein